MNNIEKIQIPTHYVPELVPAHLIAALKDYVENGTPVGDFLTAVLANDLKEALTRADPDNRLLLFQIAMWVHWEVPFNCTGSRKKVRQHIAMKAKKESRIMNKISDLNVQIYIEDDKLAAAYRDPRKSALLKYQIETAIEKILDDADSLNRADRSVFIGEAR